MQVDYSIWTIEHAVLMPVGFPNTKHIPGALQCGNVCIFVGRIRNDEEYVDDRFGCQTGNRCRSGVLKLQSEIPES